MQLKMDSDLENKLKSLVFRVAQVYVLDWDGDYVGPITELSSLVISLMDLDLKRKPNSEFMSLITRSVSLFNSLDLDSQPKPFSDLMSAISQILFNYWESMSKPTSRSEDEEAKKCVRSFAEQTMRLGPEPELVSIIFQIISNTVNTLVFLRPQGHEECEKAPVEIKHPLHPNHSLQLVLLEKYKGRKCYCGDEDIEKIFYYCYVCDFAINLACTEELPLLAIDHPKWHEHTLQLFPRQSSMICNLCGLSCSFPYIYMCPPCDFVVHRRCISLPRVIKISRHPHRLYFTFSFGRGDQSCAICRRKIEHLYGGFCCKKNGCSYATHSMCATQSNVWDGIDLEGVPEDIEEEIPEPFIRISDGVIQHFSHQHHHLTLDENTTRDYDDKKLCQMCVEPIYYENLYSCTQCEFILHEKCANLSRKIYHPIHPHKLTLALADATIDVAKHRYGCSGCNALATVGFFYICSIEGCGSNLHVSCSTINEPLFHGSHMHPLFLTSKPDERRRCSVCKKERREPFNCIECEF
ncbi:unnamed protein product [Cochlearia groenlandica]